MPLDKIKIKIKIKELKNTPFRVVHIHVPVLGLNLRQVFVGRIFIFKDSLFAIPTFGSDCNHR